MKELEIIRNKIEQAEGLYGRAQELSEAYCSDARRKALRTVREELEDELEHLKALEKYHSRKTRGVLKYFFE